MRTKVRGFTLIELMIAMAIVGILAAIAVPSYLEHVRKSKRSEAQGALVAFANAMEQWRLQNNASYCGATTGVVVAVPICATGSPAIFSQVVPISGGTKTYDLTISAVAANTYTLTATAVGAQAADGNLTLTSDGIKACTVASACSPNGSW